MPTILIVDDDFPSRRILARILEQAGHTVYDAENGYDGVRQAAAHPFDLAIVDLMMPEKDGIETILELRRAHPDLAIIAVSGGGDLGMGKDFLQVASQLGADRVLQKPIEGEGLISAVEELLSSSGKAQAEPRARAASK